MESVLAVIGLYLYETIGESISSTKRILKNNPEYIRSEFYEVDCKEV